MWLSCSCLSTADEKSMVHLDVFELEITQREENRRAAQKTNDRTDKKKRNPFRLLKDIRQRVSRSTIL